MHVVLQVLNALARMACMGYHKSYREIAVQLTGSYVNRLSTVESTYSRLAPELTTECEEVTSLCQSSAAAFTSFEKRVPQQHSLDLSCASSLIPLEQSNVYFLCCDSAT